MKENSPNPPIHCQYRHCRPRNVPVRSLIPRTLNDNYGRDDHMAMQVNNATQCSEEGDKTAAAKVGEGERNETK